MLLERVFHALGGPEAFAHPEWPKAFELEPGLMLTLLSSDDAIEIVVRERVTHSQLRAVVQVRQIAWDETVEEPCVEVVTDRDRVRRLADDVVVSLSLLLESPLSLYSSGRPDRIVPEDPADEEKIAELGTDRLTFGLRAGLPTTRRSRGGLTGDHLRDLLPRSPGLHLYADALKNTVVTAAYRDYWRVLESAFNRIDDDLLALLVQYPPVIELGLDETELRKLHVLRGRASHASSRSGLAEIRAVNNLCSASLPTLRRLAKSIITTKASWGYPTLGVEKVSSFVEVDVGREDPPGVVTRFYKDNEP